MKKVTAGTYSIALGEFISKFSYWGIQSILVLNLLKNFHLQKDETFFVYGIVTTFGFLSAFIGGFLGDKIKNVFPLLYIGGVFASIGSVCLAFNDLNIFYLGASLLVFGVGLISPNLDKLVFDLYSNSQLPVQKGFTILHGSKNLGGLLAPVMFGLIGINYSYSICFLLCSFFYIGFIVSIFKNNAIQALNTQRNTSKKIIYLLFFIPLFIFLAIKFSIIY